MYEQHKTVIFASFENAKIRTFFETERKHLLKHIKKTSVHRLKRSIAFMILLRSGVNGI